MLVKQMLDIRREVIDVMRWSFANKRVGKETDYTC